MRAAKPAAVRDFSAPHTPRQIGGNTSGQVTLEYRGFQFDLCPSEKLLWIWDRFYCAGYSFPGCAIEVRYSRGSIPGVVHGSREKVIARLRLDIDNAIALDEMRQARGEDTHYETVADWFARDAASRAQEASDVG